MKKNVISLLALAAVVMLAATACNMHRDDIVIADFESLEDARAWAEADPYVSAGVYSRVTVKPFKRVLP